MPPVKWLVGRRAYLERKRDGLTDLTGAAASPMVVERRPAGEP
jgi:hypothetical protein